MPPRIDETGKRYGKWTVLSDAGGGSRGNPHKWLCRCNCGTIRKVHQNGLRAGKSQSCGCGRHRGVQLVDHTGERHGKLTALRYAGRHNNRSFWLFRCDCGVKKELAIENVLRGNTQSCGCFRREVASVQNQRPVGEAAFNCVLRNSQYHAKKHGHNFDLTLEQVKSLHKSNCFYCNKPPSNISRRRHSNGDYIYSGIDRIDNLRGYRHDNVVPCCSICNRAKMTMSQSDFKSWIKRVHEHWAGKD